MQKYFSGAVQCFDEQIELYDLSTDSEQVLWHVDDAFVVLQDFDDDEDDATCNYILLAVSPASVNTTILMLTDDVSSPEPLEHKEEGDVTDSSQVYGNDHVPDFPLSSFAPRERKRKSNRTSKLFCPFNGQCSLQEQPQRLHSFDSAFDQQLAKARGNFANFYNLDPATVTRAATCLVKAGMVSRVKNIHDTRSVLLTLTEKGAPLAALYAQRIKTTYETLETMIGESLSEKERTQFLTILYKISKRTDDMRHYSKHLPDLNEYSDDAVPSAADL